MPGNKYSARKTPYNGVLYDSKSEAEYAGHLDLLVCSGQIARWARAAPIALVPGPRAWGITYTADFRVWGDLRPNRARGGDPAAPMGEYLIEVKGHETEAFRLRLKLLRHTHPEVRLLIVRPDGAERWAW